MAIEMSNLANGSDITALAASKLTGALPAIDGSALTNLSAGKVLQVVSTTKTSVFSTGSTSWTDITGMSASITPSSASSKVFVQVDVTVGTGTNAYAFGKLVRGATDISVGDASGSRNRCTFSLSGNSTHYTKADNRGFNYLDSPSTTSATTYKLQVYTNDTVKINTTGEDEDNTTGGIRGTSTITLMEIGA